MGQIYKVSAKSERVTYGSYKKFVKLTWNDPVALSRVASLNGLHLIGNFNLAVIRADPRAINECQQTQKKQLAPVIITSISNKFLNLILLNTRSFSKHAIDISKDKKRLLQADILCLRETQIKLAKNTQMSQQHLSELQFLHNRSEDKF